MRILLIVAVASAVAFMAYGCDKKAQVAGSDLLAAGWDAFRIGEFDRAEDYFESAEKDRDQEVRAQALYGLGMTWNLRRPGEDPVLATKLFERASTEAPGSTITPWSLLALARIRHLRPIGEQTDRAEAQAAYQKVSEQFPDHPAAHEAFVYQHALLVETLDPADARQALESLLAFAGTHPDSGFASPLYGLIAQCHETLGQAREALAARIHALEVIEPDPDTPNDMAANYWRIAVAAEFDVGDFPVAQRYYRKLIAMYPKDQRVFRAKQALTRMERVERELALESSP
jgi:tetratricopeptide (TPR) repeat protein